MTHEQARYHCCAACGRTGATIGISPAIEKLIKEFVHPTYDVSVESFPSGCCPTYQRAMYNCRKAKKLAQPVEPWERDAWKTFQLQDIRVPRTSAKCSQCTCPMCHAAHYNPVGVVGRRDITCTPVVNPLGGPMKCEVETEVPGIRS